MRQSIRDLFRRSIETPHRAALYDANQGDHNQGESNAHG
jgi:hypothetical protein